MGNDAKDRPMLILILFELAIESAGISREDS